MGHVSHLRDPDGGATGLEFATTPSIRATDAVLGHSLPERVDVEVRDDDGALVARGENLSHPETTPMSRLRITGDTVERENVWPNDADAGMPVILPGGEVGILLEWSNASDRSEWRWRVEFHNHA